MLKKQNPVDTKTSGKKPSDFFGMIIITIMILSIGFVVLYNLLPLFQPHSKIIYPDHEEIVALSTKENISPEKAMDLIKLLDKSYWYVYDLAKESGETMRYKNETWYFIPDPYNSLEVLDTYYSQYWSDEAVTALLKIPQLLGRKYAFPSKIEDERIDWDTAFFDGLPSMTDTEVQAAAGNETYYQSLADTYGIDGTVLLAHLFNLKRSDSVWKMSYSEILIKNYLQPTTTFQEIADKFSADNPLKEPPVRVALKDLAKSPSKYVAKYVEFEGTIYEIRENVATNIIVTDGYNYIYVLYLNETDCYKGDYVEIIGFCMGAYSNISINGFPLTQVDARDVIKLR